MEGANLENKILDIAQKGNLRILGPNSIGIINISDSVILSANAMLELPKLKKGGLGVISQSGSLIGALLAHGSSRGIGFSKLISVGNETDLSVGEIGKMLVDDVNTDTIILFLETLRNSNEIAEMARLAYSSGKAVITYKLGKSDLGKELAKSHTGAIAGSDEAFNALPDGTVADLLEDPTGQLANILLHHVYVGNALSTDLSDGMMIPTLLGTSLNVSIEMSGAVMIENSMVTVSNIEADNGWPGSMGGPSPPI